MFKRHFADANKALKARRRDTFTAHDSRLDSLAYFSRQATLSIDRQLNINEKDRPARLARWQPRFSRITPTRH